MIFRKRCNTKSHILVFLFFLFTILILHENAKAQSDTKYFGDVKIHIATPEGSNLPLSGYREIKIQIENTSKKETHKVEVRFSVRKDAYKLYRYQMRNEAVVTPLTTKTIFMYAPDIYIDESFFRVTIDEKLQSNQLDIDISHSHYRSGKSLSYHRSENYVKLSEGVSVDALSNLAIISRERSRSKDLNFLKTQDSTENWSENWIAYTCYQAIFVDSKAFNHMPENVRTAIEYYVRAGGFLLVFGEEARLPQRWKGKEFNCGDAKLTNLGFGAYAQMAINNVKKWDKKTLNEIRRIISNSSIRSGKESTEDMNEYLPLIKEINVPIAWIFALICVFSLLIGPINFFILGKKKKRIWVFWTIPLISLTATVAFLYYSIKIDGTQGRTISSQITILDNDLNLATTIAEVGYYTPIGSKGGLCFDYNTEVSPLTRNQSTKIKSIDWSKSQYFDSGWLPVRIPTYFTIRKNQTRHESVTFSNNKKDIEVNNALGHKILTLWYADSQGKIFKQTNIASGEKKKLEPSKRIVHGNFTYLKIYDRNTLLTKKTKNIIQFPWEYLIPNSYVAILDENVFLGNTMQNAKEGKCKSIILGTLGGSEL